MSPSRRLAGFAAALWIFANLTGPAFAGKKPKCDACDPPCKDAMPTAPSTPTTPSTPSAPGAAADPAAPGAPSAAVPAPAAPLDADLASSTDVAGAAESIAPFMFGDSFGINNNIFVGYTATGGSGFTGGPVGANMQTPVAGGRRIKIAESTSPMPRDRVFFSYNFFNDAYSGQGVGGNNSTPSGFLPDPSRGVPSSYAGGSNGINVNRYIFGVEKTFFDGWMSAEIRVPFSQSIDDTLTLANNGAAVGSQATNIDNVTVTLKSLLYARNRTFLSAGLSINTPTAPGVGTTQSFAFDPSNPLSPVGGNITTSILVRNQAVHLLPYIGMLLTPTDKLFIQGYTQCDVGLNGNDVIFNKLSPTTSDLANITGPVKFKSNDQTLLHLDLAAGYWIYRNPCARGLTGVAPMLEGHYTSTLQNADIFSLSGSGPSSYQMFYGNTYNRLDVVNLTAGVVTLLGERTYIQNGFVVPLSNASDGNRQFNWEYTLQINYRFGGAYRAGRTSPLFGG